MYQCSIPVLNEECRLYEINGNIFIKFTGFIDSENNQLSLKALQNPHQQIHRKWWIRVSVLDGFSIQVLDKFILTSQLGHFIIWFLTIHMRITVPPYLFCIAHWSIPALVYVGKRCLYGYSDMQKAVQSLVVNSKTHWSWYIYIYILKKKKLNSPLLFESKEQLSSSTTPPMLRIR